MKTLVTIAVIAVIVLGFFAFTNKGEQSSVSHKGFSGVVTEVNLEGAALDGPVLVHATDAEGKGFIVAVPSFGLPLCEAFTNIADVYQIKSGDRIEVNGSADENDRVVPCESADHYLRVIGVVLDQEVELAFEYRKGPDGYVLESIPVSGFPESSFIKGYQLMTQSDYDDLVASEAPREGPPTIQILVFKNEGNQSASNWVDEFSQFSNIGLALGEINRDATLSGANAVHYKADGLYVSEVIVAASGGYIYMVSGAYIDEASIIRSDFEPFADSIEFIQGSDTN